MEQINNKQDRIIFEIEELLNKMSNQVNFLIRKEINMNQLDVDLLMENTRKLYERLCSVELKELSVDNDADFEDADADTDADFEDADADTDTDFEDTDADADFEDNDTDFEDTDADADFEDNDFEDNDAEFEESDSNVDNDFNNINSEDFDNDDNADIVWDFTRNDDSDVDTDNDFEDADADTDFEDTDADNDFEDADADNDFEDVDTDNDFEDTDVDTDFEDADAEDIESNIEEEKEKTNTPLTNKLIESEKEEDSGIRTYRIVRDNVHTLGDILERSEDNSLAARLQRKPVTDLIAAIGINDKFLFLNELFNGSMEKYNKSIRSLNSFSTLLGAKTYMSELQIEFQWDCTSDAYKKLNDLVERRFI